MVIGSLTPNEIDEPRLLLRDKHEKDVGLRYDLGDLIFMLPETSH